MAKLPYVVETLPKISIFWVGRTNVTDDRRQTDGRWHIANMNLSSRSLIKRSFIISSKQIEEYEQSSSLQGRNRSDVFDLKTPQNTL